MSTCDSIPDGVYVIWPDGCGWEAQEWKNNRCVSQTCEADMGTHNAARDSWAGFDPNSATEDVDLDVVRAVCPNSTPVHVIVFLVPD